MSTETPKLASALVKAQGIMEEAKKDSTNPHFRSKYADLASIVAVLREPLSKNGLGFIQDVKSDKDGVSVRTTLVHESGERLAGEWLFLPVTQQTPQAYGSAVTYGKRYSLAALVGVVCDEDDDGDAASGKEEAKAPAKRKGVVPDHVPAKLKEMELKNQALARANAAMAAKESNEAPKHKGRLLSEMKTEELKEAAQEVTDWMHNNQSAPSRAKGQKQLDAIYGELDEREIRAAENAAH